MSNKAKYPCDHHDGARCTLGLFLGEPSPGTCLLQCSSYSGRERTQELYEATIGTHPIQNPAKKKTAELAAEWLHHEAALITKGPCSRAVHAHRHACCTGLTIEGGRVSPACPAFKAEDPKTPDGARRGICESCGCGERERARIEPAPDVDAGEVARGVKLWCPTYICPRRHFGAVDPAPGGTANLEPFLGKGIAGQVGEVLKAAGGEVLKLLGLRSDPDPR